MEWQSGIPITPVRWLTAKHKVATNAEVAAQYEKSAPMARTGADKMCRSYVDSALGVYNRVLVHQAALDLVNQMACLKGKKSPKL